MPPTGTLTLADLPPILLTTFGVALGLVFGSFLNVVIHRLPRGQNVAFPASKCPACGRPIAGYDNIPVLSWLMLRGKARCCGAPISVRYPLVELLGGLFAWAILRVLIADLPLSIVWWHALLLFLLYLALCLGLLAATFIDLEHMILPDEITLGGAALGLISIPIRDIGIEQALVGGALGFLIVYVPFIVVYTWLRGHPGMGLGDAKLLLLAGMWFGWQGVVFALLAGAVQGTIVALVIYLMRGKLEEPSAVREEREALEKELAELDREERLKLEAELGKDPLALAPNPGLAQARIAFGPFLALSIIEFLFIGDWVVAEYWQTLWLA